MNRFGEYDFKIYYKFNRDQYIIIINEFSKLLRKLILYFIKKDTKRIIIIIIEIIQPFLNVT